MRKTTSGLLSLALASGLGAMLTVPTAVASPAPSQGSFGEPQAAAPSDSLPDPIADKQAELRKTAVASVLKGEAKPERIGNSTVVKVGEAERAATAAKGNRKAQKAKKVDQYVELAREDTDELFVLVVQFGNERLTPELPRRTPTRTSPAPPPTTGRCSTRSPSRTARWTTPPTGTRRTARRTTRTSTSATAPSPGRESMRQYYEKQSSGRYTIAGMVTDPVTVQYNEARYGRSDGYPCASNVCSNTWTLVRDGMKAWVAQQTAAGKTDAADRRRSSSDYDIWDRYDWDGDGNFDEPDGYIDHLQIVHAGGDQADGDPIQGEDAIWSHRWRAFQGTNPRRADPAAGWHPGRRHLDLGRRLHRAARERRPVGHRPRVRSRPRPARPLRHLRAVLAQREPGQLVDPDGPEPGLRAR